MKRPYSASTFFSLSNLLWFGIRASLGGFWARWIRFWSQNLEIQNGGARMADRNCKVFVQTHNQCPTQPTSTEFYLNQSVLSVFSFAIFVCHFEFLNFEFRFVISNVNNNPWVPRFIQMKPSFALLIAILDPPIWILEFWVQIRNQQPK